MTSRETKLDRLANLRKPMEKMRRRAGLPARPTGPQRWPTSKLLDKLEREIQADEEQRKATERQLLRELFRR